jgi:hypothetical protein
MRHPGHLFLKKATDSRFILICFTPFIIIRGLKIMFFRKHIFFFGPLASAHRPQQLDDVQHENQTRHFQDTILMGG